MTGETTPILSVIWIKIKKGKTTIQQSPPRRISRNIFLYTYSLC